MARYAAGEIAPCRVFDANGLEWHDVTWVDTDAGEVEQVERDGDGRFLVSDDGSELRRRRVKTAAPLLLIPVEKN